MSQFPKTYKAYAFLERGGSLKPIDVEWKDAKPGEVIVKVLACGVCASDRTVKEGWFPTQEYPRIPGHEIIGDVVAVAQGESVWKVGDRVGAGWHGGQCHTCPRCRMGDFVTCSVGSVANGVGRDGGFAEYVHLRSEALASVPKDLDPAEAAPLMCAGITTFNALRHMTVTPPDFVAIQGIGGLGHLAIQYSRQMGYRTIALSTSENKRELALKLGAHDFIAGTAAEQAAALQKIGGAKVIMVTADDTAAMNELVHGLGIDGELCIVALSPGSVTVPVSSLVTKRLSIRGWPIGTGKDLEDTADFAHAHGIKALVQKFPLEKAQEAYESYPSARFRAVLIP